MVDLVGHKNYLDVTNPKSMDTMHLLHFVCGIVPRR